MRIIELAVVMIAVLIPQFILAVEVDGDEFAKATTGIALGAVVVGAYRVWLGTRPAKGSEDVDAVT